MKNFRPFSQIFVEGPLLGKNLMTDDQILRIPDSEWARMQREQEDAKRKAEAYEDAVLKQLQKVVAHNRAGLSVVNRINWEGQVRKRQVIIRPYGPWEDSKAKKPTPASSGLDYWKNYFSVCNAQAGPSGTGSTISYSPDTASEGTMCSVVKKTSLRESTPDEWLLHELVHALRWLTGKIKEPPSYETEHRYNAKEEFLAILITNIFRAEKRPGVKLRSFNYGNPFDDPLPDYLSTSEGFLGRLKLTGAYGGVVDKDALGDKQKEHIWRVSELYKEEAYLFHDISWAPGKFNPIQFFLAHKKQYEDAK